MSCGFDPAASLRQFEKRYVDPWSDYVPHPQFSRDYAIQLTFFSTDKWELGDDICNFSSPSSVVHSGKTGKMLGESPVHFVLPGDK